MCEGKCFVSGGCCERHGEAAEGDSEAHCWRDNEEEESVDEVMGVECGWGCCRMLGKDCPLTNGGKQCAGYADDVMENLLEI